MDSPLVIVGNQEWDIVGKVVLVVVAKVRAVLLPLNLGLAEGLAPMFDSSSTQLFDKGNWIDKIVGQEIDVRNGIDFLHFGQKVEHLLLQLFSITF